MTDKKSIERPIEQSIEELEAMLAKRKAEAKAAEAAAKVKARQESYCANNAGRREYLKDRIKRDIEELRKILKKSGLPEEDIHE